MLEYIIPPEEENHRVREVLRRGMRLSGTALKKAKWNGEIRLNGEPVFVDQRVHAGDRLQVVPPEEAPAYQPRPYPLPLSIPWMDDHLIIVDKPAPLASQSSAAHPADSLENAVYSFLGCPENFVYRPVNRLDKGTSGLMVIARNAHAQDLLQRLLHTGDFRREYLALTDGVPSPREGTLDLPIRKAPGATVRRIVDPAGKPARTRYRVVADDGLHALVRLQLETGRTHQIRLHLSHIGCPVRGDFLYGTEQPEELPGRFALHSAFLTLRHPLTGEWIRLQSLPPFAEAAFPPEG